MYQQQIDKFKPICIINVGNIGKLKTSYYQHYQHALDIRRGIKNDKDPIRLSRQAKMAKINKESVDAVRTAVLELESAGYVVREQMRAAQGTFVGLSHLSDIMRPFL